MLDRDLAELYGVETKRLKESVRRNIARFPGDFMFEMSKEELQIWRTHFASSNSELKGLRHPPFCFTELGVTMLACTLNSSQAIQMNIQIIRVFSRLKEAIAINGELIARVAELESRLGEHDDQIASIFRAIRKLMPSPATHERKEIGFKTGPAE